MAVPLPGEGETSAAQKRIHNLVVRWDPGLGPAYDARFQRFYSIRSDEPRPLAWAGMKQTFWSETYYFFVGSNSPRLNFAFCFCNSTFYPAIRVVTVCRDRNLSYR
jgi:hypothetical protein